MFFYVRCCWLVSCVGIFKYETMAVYNNCFTQNCDNFNFCFITKGGDYSPGFSSDSIQNISPCRFFLNIAFYQYMFHYQFVKKICNIYYEFETIIFWLKTIVCRLTLSRRRAHMLGHGFPITFSSIIIGRWHYSYVLFLYFYYNQMFSTAHFFYSTN